MQRAGRFTNAADILRRTIREAGEARGFAATRLLTHWAEIVGEDLAAIARPLEIRHPRPRKGEAAPEGATLTVLALGAAALRIEMERERIRARVNACYGYNAVARLRIRQTTAEGFAEARARFAPAPGAAEDRRVAEAAVEATEGVGDTTLRLALAALAANVLRKSRP
jgi:hypothetical protein